MTDVTIYHNPRCSKSRETLALVEAKGIRPTIVEYLKSPPTVEELTRILALLGKSPRDILRSKEAGEAGIDPDTLDDAALIRAMVTHPAAIERPIVVTGSKAALGRPPHSVLDIL